MQAAQKVFNENMERDGMSYLPAGQPERRTV